MPIKGPTIRLKLTLWYGGMFLLAGGLLITLTYVLVREGFEPSPRSVRETVAERLNIPPEALEGGQRGSSPFYYPGSNERPDGMLVGRLISEIQEEQMQQQLTQLLVWSLIALGIMAVLSLGLGWVLAGRLLRPVHDLTDLARRLSDSTLHERIRLQRRPDELKELADTFDGMLERLDTAFASQRDFIANASHELRTPLTIIRTELEVAMSDPDLSREELEAMAAAVGDAVARSEDLIDRLLVLARSDVPIETTAVDVNHVVEASVKRHAEAAAARDLRVELAVEPVVVHGDLRLLGHMVDNLIDNAVRHNEDGGWLSVSTSRSGTRAVFTVAGSGAAVSEEDAPRLFDRFFRTDASRSRRTGGSGLGLSIVKAVAEAHHGTTAAKALRGGGLEVTVTLPLSA